MRNTCINAGRAHAPACVMCVCMCVCVCVSHMQGEQVLRDGIGQSPEVEEPLTSATQRTQARGWLTQPDDMMKASPLLQSLNT